MKEHICYENNEILPRDFLSINEVGMIGNSYNLGEKTSELLNVALDYDDVGAAYSKKFSINISFLNADVLVKLNWLIMALIIIVVGYMFRVKSHVQDLNFELKQLNSQIEQENNQYNLLKAELAYLNSPARLQKLAMEYLNLEQIKPHQIVMQESKNAGRLSVKKFTELSSKKSTKRWRYKKGPTRVKTASTKHKAF